MLESYLNGIDVWNDLKFFWIIAVVNTGFLQSKEVSEVDVFDHPRFCDEFSHLVNRHYLNLLLSVEVPLEWNKSLKRFIRSLNCQIYFAVVNTRFLQSKEVCEVDVFDHPRFCDEFSHLVNKHVEEPASLCWSLNWMKYTFETIKNILLNCEIYIAVVNTRFLQSREVC